MKMLSLSLEQIKSEKESKAESPKSVNKRNSKNISNRSIFTISDGLKLITLNKTTYEEKEKIKNQVKLFNHNHSFSNTTTNHRRSFDNNLLDINLIKGSSIFKNSIIDGVLGTIDVQSEKNIKKTSSRSNESNFQIDNISNLTSNDNFISQTQNLFFKKKTKSSVSNICNSNNSNNNSNYKKLNSYISKAKIEKSDKKKKNRQEKMRIILLNKINGNKDEFPYFSTGDSREELIPRNISKISEEQQKTQQQSQPQSQQQSQQNTQQQSQQSQQSQQNTQQQIHSQKQSQIQQKLPTTNCENRYTKKEGICKKALKINPNYDTINESIENYPKIPLNNSNFNYINSNEGNNLPFINFESNNFTNISNSIPYENHLLMSTPNNSNRFNQNENKAFINNKELKFELFRNNKMKDIQKDLQKDLNSNLHNLNSIFNNTTYKSSLNRYVYSMHKNDKNLLKNLNLNKGDYNISNTNANGNGNSNSNINLNANGNSNININIYSNSNNSNFNITSPEMKYNFNNTSNNLYQYEASTQTKMYNANEKNDKEVLMRHNPNKTTIRSFYEKTNSFKGKIIQEKNNFFSTTIGLKRKNSNAYEKNNFFFKKDLEKTNSNFIPKILNNNIEKPINPINSINSNDFYMTKMGSNSFLKPKQSSLRNTNEFIISKYFNVCIEEKDKLNESNSFKSTSNKDIKLNKIALKKVDKIYEESNINKDLLKNTKILGENCLINKNKKNRELKAPSEKIKRIKYSKSVKMKHLLLDIINPQKRNVFNFNPTVDEANDKERLIQKLPVIDFRI